MFNALVVEKADDGQVSAAVRSISEGDLPSGEVLVKVDFSTINYKDGLCVTGAGNLVKDYPHVPGIDFAGTVEKSSDARYQAGDKVILTGWRVGEIHWGGYAQKASVKADWLVPLPANMTTKQAMVIGTAGFTAMLAIDTLEQHGLSPDKGEVLVTGATGGVGSVAVLLLAKLGYQVAAVTGKASGAQMLKSLGASTIIERAELSEPNNKPLESERWAAAIDSVGGEMLGRVQKQLKYGGGIASIGLAGGVAVPSFTVIPYLLRGVSLLGIDSVMCPPERRAHVWQRIAETFPFAEFEAVTTTATLAELPTLATDILQGKLSGRFVIDVNT